MWRKIGTVNWAEIELELKLDFDCIAASAGRGAKSDARRPAGRALSLVENLLYPAPQASLPGVGCRLQGLLLLLGPQPLVAQGPRVLVRPHGPSHWLAPEQGLTAPPPTLPWHRLSRWGHHYLHSWPGPGGPVPARAWALESNRFFELSGSRCRNYLEPWRCEPLCVIAQCQLPVNKKC